MSIPRRIGECQNVAPESSTLSGRNKEIERNCMMFSSYSVMEYRVRRVTPLLVESCEGKAFSMHAHASMRHMSSLLLRRDVSLDANGWHLARFGVYGSRFRDDDVVVVVVAMRCDPPVTPSYHIFLLSFSSSFSVDALSVRSPHHHFRLIFHLINIPQQFLSFSIHFLHNSASHVFVGLVTYAFDVCSQTEI